MLVYNVTLDIYDVHVLSTTVHLNTIYFLGVRALHEDD